MRCISGMADERDVRTEGRCRREQERRREGGEMEGVGWGKKKEERIKRRVAVVLPIDNGFHLYNSTPRATLNPFCLFSLMLFYHPFAAVFHVSPITCHPRTYALFFRQNSLLSFSSRRSLLMSLLLPSFLLSHASFLSFRFSINHFWCNELIDGNRLYGNDSRSMNFIRTNRC